MIAVKLGLKFALVSATPFETHRLLPGLILARIGGLFFGFVREKPGSITTSAIAHGIACAAGVIDMYLSPKGRS